MLELNKSLVTFDPVEHVYRLDGVVLQGVTGMLGRQLFPNKYSSVPESVLAEAAERGKYIHECCDVADDIGVEPDCKEAQNYLRLTKDITRAASEYLISDNEHFASSIDKVYRESDDTFSLADIKTTYKLDAEYVRWQLSIYAYFFELQNPNAKVGKLFAIWLRDDNAKIVEVERISTDVIKELLQCEVEGKQFVNPLKDETALDHYRAIEDTIADVIKQAEYWAAKKKELADGIMQEMVKAGTYSWKGDIVSFIRKKDTIREDFDKKTFKAEHPDLYEQYVKETPIVGSLTIKLK